MAAEDVGPHVARARAALLSLERLEVPTIVALDGLALGGGLEVSLACDIRIACEHCYCPPFFSLFVYP